jgi:hypothetical protein
LTPGWLGFGTVYCGRFGALANAFSIAARKASAPSSVSITPLMKNVGVPSTP